MPLAATSFETRGENDATATTANPRQKSDGQKVEAKPASPSDQPVKQARPATEPSTEEIPKHRTTLEATSAGSAGPSTTVLTTTRTGGQTYYIAPKLFSGNGTINAPFGLPDLLNTTTTPISQGQALKVLQPGDSLYFRGGTYTVNGHPNGNYTLFQLISPVVSGTSAAPITLAAYPGETVVFKMNVGAQPLFGTSQPVLDHVRFQGFTILNLTCNHAITLAGTGNEVASCSIVGNSRPALTDNYDGIWLQNANNSWVHHNEAAGFTCANHNGSGIKIYASTHVIIEDNYMHHNGVGIFDKDGGGNGSSQAALSDNTYRRNYLTANTTNQFLGNNQYGPSTLHIYDNVIDGDIDLNVLSNNDEIYNNLLRTKASNDGMVIGIYGNTSSPPGTVYRQNIWNNIILTGGSSFRGFWNPNTAFSVGRPNSPLTYMDYNVYDGEPRYDFGSYIRVASSFSLAEFRAKGFERHSSVNVSASTIFLDQTAFSLKSNWTTAGRYGDPVGPRFPVAQILNISRYGPGTQPATTTTIVRQPQDQSVTVGNPATFQVQVNGPTIAFRWQRSKDRGRTWVIIPGATTASYTTPRSRTTDHGMMFRVLVNHSGGTIYSDKATLTIKRKIPGK